LCEKAGMSAGGVSMTDVERAVHSESSTAMLETKRLYITIVYVGQEADQCALRSETERAPAPCSSPLAFRSALCFYA
jgi:hypothetical protein